MVMNMKYLVIVLLLLGMAAPTRAVDKADLDKFIRRITTKLEAMQAKPDKRIPAESLRNAKGIVLLDRTKAGFVFAFEGGGGLAMVKDAKSGSWSAPAFMRANEASLGLQIGGQQSFVVMLLMNTNATRALTDSNVNFGGEASGTAGNAAGKADGTIPADTGQVVMVYSDSTGFYGGVSVKGGDLSPDTDANVAYYGQSLTPKEILFDQKVKPSDTATALAQQISLFSK
jgi:SH3 domain-containing YSC84-like protein 1